MTLRRLLGLILPLALLAACSRSVDPAVFEEEITTTPGVVITRVAPGAPTDTPRFQPPGPPATGAPASPTPSFPTRPPRPHTPTPDPPRGLTPDVQVDTYVVGSGDTLAAIAYQYGTTVESLIALNNLRDPDHLIPGMVLRVPVQADVQAQPRKLIPDSELVYGPAAKGFDVASFAAPYGGYLLSYAEDVEGRWRGGPEIVQLVAQRFSVNPRLLLALLELKAGWVTNPNPPETVYPMGAQDGFRAGLYNQLAWASDQLNAGYYGWKWRGLTTARLNDARVLLPDGLNAGTAGVEYFLAQRTDYAAWQRLVAPEGFSAIYARFFGDPFAYAVEPLVPATLKQPPLALPWPKGATWFFTGGPHGGWGDGGAWAGLDFVPPLAGTDCSAAPEWATAMAAGLVVRSGDGQVVIDLDGDGFEGTGWTLHYSHLATDGRVAAGTLVNADDPIGHPSCEGGFSNATHVHIARRYNGEWIAADGPIPFDLSGWISAGSGQVYDGSLQRNDQWRYACECKEDVTNGVTR